MPYQVYPYARWTYISNTSGNYGATWQIPSNAAAPMPNVSMQTVRV
ncbi:MAG: hypothetical protein ACYDCC_04790 [Actinomycetota bacterium]